MPNPPTSKTADTFTPSPYLQEKGQTSTDNDHQQHRTSAPLSPTKQADTHEDSALQSGSDQQDASISSGQRVNGKKPFSFWMSLLSLALTAIVTSWDATALAVALPHITEQLQGTTLESFWANISFMLGVAVTQPIYVSFSDVLGRKIPFYASTGIFIIGTIVFSTAQDMSVLVAGRLVQGIGCGGLDVLEEIILADITTLKERPMYLGIIAMSIAAGSISGPIIGALLSEYDWRWIGWVNLPVIGPALVLAIFFLHLRPLDGGLTTRLRRVDWTGMALFASGATLFALPLSWADALYAWASWRTIVPFVIGLILLIIFGFYEKKPPEAILPYRLFKNRTAVSSMVTGLIHGLILYTALQYLPLFFQAVFLEEPLQAGVSTLPVAISVVAFSILAPVTVEITRRYQLLLWIGWICTTVAMGTWYLVDENTPRVTAYTIQVFLGIGIGIVYTVTQFAVQASVEDVNDTGLVSTFSGLMWRLIFRLAPAVGMLVVVRLFGALIGLAVAATVFSSVFQRNISLLGELPESARVLNDASHAISFIPALRTLQDEMSRDTVESLVEVYRKSFGAIWIFMTCCSGLGLVVSAAIKELSLESEEMGEQGFERPAAQAPREAHL